jgi:nicotinate-nucleotide pyrophosphorylase (carboxylating)
MQASTYRLSEATVSQLQRALEEDTGTGDVTTNSIVPAEGRLTGKIIAKQDGIVAGLDVARAVFALLDPGVEMTALCPEGSKVENRQLLATVSGQARALLTAERTALNILGRMSGIATYTRKFVDAVAGTKAVILDTRKTAPGLRELDKLAVLRGGGANHRMGLFDMALVKDNHIDLAGSISEAVRRVRQHAPGIELEVEARTLKDVQEALELRVPRILLDNMKPEEMSHAVALSAGRAQLEASGNVTLQNVRRIAETGVDFISVGALTHSVRSFDVTLLIE